MSEDESKKAAQSARDRSNIKYPKDVDDITQRDIIQNYSHRRKGDILIINTNKHYQFYKEMHDGTNTKLVSQANFRAATVNYMREKLSDSFDAFNSIDIWKKDVMFSYDKKKNIELIEVVPRRK